MTRMSSLFFLPAVLFVAACTNERPATAPAPVPATVTSPSTSTVTPPTAPGATAPNPTAATPSSVESLALRVIELENRVVKLEETVKSHGDPAQPSKASGGMGGMHDDMMGSMKSMGGSMGDKPMTDKPMGDKPMGDKAMGSKPMGDKPMGKKPMGMKKEHGSMGGSAAGSDAGSATPSGMGGMEDM